MKIAVRGIGENKKKTAALSVYDKRFLNCFIHFDGRTDTAFVTGAAKAPSSKAASIGNATAQDTSCYKSLRELIHISATVLSYFSYSAQLSSTTCQFQWSQTSICCLPAIKYSSASEIAAEGKNKDITCKGMYCGSAATCWKHCTLSQRDDLSFNLPRL